MVIRFYRERMHITQRNSTSDVYNLAQLPEKAESIRSRY